MKLFAIRHPGALLGPPFNQGEQPYLLVLPLDQGERPFLQNSSWSKSMECLMTQMQWKITSSRGRLKTPLHLQPVVRIQIPCNAAMKAHDSEDFKVAMIKEANDHTTRLHWALWEK
jgi:hypothetical protein